MRGKSVERCESSRVLAERSDEEANGAQSEVTFLPLFNNFRLEGVATGIKVRPEFRESGLSCGTDGPTHEQAGKFSHLPVGFK